jgi:hypothetical protein
VTNRKIFLVRDKEYVSFRVTLKLVVTFQKTTLWRWIQISIWGLVEEGKPEGAQSDPGQRWVAFKTTHNVWLCSFSRTVHSIWFSPRSLAYLVLHSCSPSSCNFLCFLLNFTTLIFNLYNILLNMVLQYSIKFIGDFSFIF